jgi:hypothetical protein
MGRAWRSGAASTRSSRAAPAVNVVAMTALTRPMAEFVPDEHPAPDPGYGGRDPAHTLYDEAARLLATAQALDAATHAPGAVAALAPTLACMEASAEALARAIGRLRDHALQRLSEPVLPARGLRQRRGEIARSFDRLESTLEHAAGGTVQARRAVAPVATELAAI